MTKPNVRIQDGEAPRTLGDPKPSQDYLFVQMHQRPTTTPGGVDISADSSGPLPYGLVRAKGPNCSEFYKLGQHVIVPPHAGSLIDLGISGADFRMVRECDVIGYFDMPEKGG